jgi:hypothetical protein
MAELLPDCRAREAKGTVLGPMGNMVPIFCANCGTQGGWVPEENMTFLYWLCNTCAETYGPIANTMMMPDEVFFERLKQEQIDKYGRFLTEQEIVAVIEEGTSALAKLIKEGG